MHLCKNTNVAAKNRLARKRKKSVNACNTTHDVKWVYSYANADKTKTFCIYEAPNEKAIQDAATGNKIPIDYIVEIPLVLNPK